MPDGDVKSGLQYGAGQVGQSCTYPCQVQLPGEVGNRDAEELQASDNARGRHRVVDRLLAADRCPRGRQKRLAATRRRAFDITEQGNRLWRTNKKVRGITAARQDMSEAL